MLQSWWQKELKCWRSLQIIVVDMTDGAHKSGARWPIFFSLALQCLRLISSSDDSLTQFEISWKDTAMADVNKRKERTGNDRDQGGLKRSKVCGSNIFTVWRSEMVCVLSVVWVFYSKAMGLTELGFPYHLNFISHALQLYSLFSVEVG